MILLEKHPAKCGCSYCSGETRLHYGLNIPPHWWAWNAWYTIKYWPRHYLRWTNRWFRFVFNQEGS